MKKDRSWMYGSNELLKFVDGILEFCSAAIKLHVKTEGVGFYAHM